ncbi:MAG: DUF2934 domain-containing protein [Bryobacteraceae bacterium]|nr:DUF2934 domain-containing protein [Bryobacteraceae bacterium]
MTEDKTNPGPESLRQEIEKRAYTYWEQAGRPEGADQAHWFRAETELLSSSEEAQPEVSPEDLLHAHGVGGEPL